MNKRRTRANSAPLNARVTLELANRLRQHIADAGYRNLSDFVTAAIEEKLARETAEVDATELSPSEPISDERFLAEEEEEPTPAMAWQRTDDLTRLVRETLDRLVPQL